MEPGPGGAGWPLYQAYNLRDCPQGARKRRLMCPQVVSERTFSGLPGGQVGRGGNSFYESSYRTLGGAQLGAAEVQKENGGRSWRQERGWL